MCGISLIIDPSNTVDRGVILKMNNEIIHRGPDGEGYYFDDICGLAMGHRRLAIIDLTDGGQQPMHWYEKYIVIFNGEIYNYIEIKEELIEFGYHFKTQSDTEVILASYDQWGINCFKKFNGMWAIVIYDKLQKKVILSRDQFGIKPLYYTIIGDKLYASSEIRQLIRTGIVIPRPNYSVLMNFLIFGFNQHNEETFYESILSLTPSYNMIYDLETKTISKYRYFELLVNKNVREMSEQDAINGYVDLLKHSIKIRLRSDVKLGSCLSGGLDSSIIASYASSIYNSQSEKFTGITASSIDINNDESKWAEILALYSKLDWVITRPEEEQFHEYLDEVIKCQEEPFGSPSVLMQFFVMMKSADFNCTVLLDGQGGDETMLGYERYFPAYLNSLNIYERFKEAIKISKHSKLNFIQIFGYYIYFNSWFLKKIIAKKRHKGIKEKYFKLINWKNLRSTFFSNRIIDNYQKTELESSCLPHLLKLEDKNSMWHSIETRLPFLDHRVVEFAYSINSNFKIKNGWTKNILRVGAKDLVPDSILWRKNKFGFEAPYSIWMSNKPNILKVINESSLIKEITNYVPLDMKNIEILWRYYSIALWEKEFKIEP
jgi:asparagine synthase (glutamine-hydrolysing)